MKSKIVLISSIVLCELAGIVGSVFTFPSIDSWYSKLLKPSFSPPNWVFAPVWVLLYLLMGVSAYLVWEKGIKKKNVKDSLEVFGLQLVLNTLWSLVFFGLQSPFYGLIEIVLLWVAILATMVKFHKISKTATLLLLPYILWVSFAMILNFYVWRLN